LKLTVPALCVVLSSAVPAAQQTADEFVARLKDERHGRLMQGAFWTVSHASADEQHVRRVLQPVVDYWDALGRGDRSALEPAGIKAFKDRLAGLLTDKEQSIRGLAAVILGVCGDRSYANQLAVLLKPRAVTRDELLYDRGRAAMALGFIGAKEYSGQLVDLLRSSNIADRSGAALGLGALQATEHRDAVARLLKDVHDDVREAAKESLAMMGDVR
jgi:FOG: HEAT repeat